MNEKNLEKFSRLFPEFISQLKDSKEKVSPPLDPSDWVSVLNLAEKNEIFVYGIGNGEAYSFLKPWLKEDPSRSLILLEPDFSCIKTLLKEPLGDEIFSDPQVQLFPVPYNQDMGNVSMWLAIQTAASDAAFVMIKDPRIAEEAYQSFLESFNYNLDTFNWFVSEYKLLGGPYFYNFYANLSSLNSYFSGSHLFGKYKDTPAFIVGAGPSLGKNGSLLNEAKKKGFVFAGGSAIPALSFLQIEPSVGVGIDPNKTEFERLKNIPIDYPYFFRMRLNSEALQAIQGPKFYIPGGGGYPISSWFENRLAISGKQILEGHNVVNFMTSIALEMGCNPIIFVGLDLSFTSLEQPYAKGVELETTYCDCTKETDIYSKEVLTRWVWLKERNWMYNLVKEHPQTQFYNATEGGILKLPLVTLEKIIASLTDKEPTLEKKPLEVKEEDIAKNVLYLRKSLIELKEILNRISSCNGVRDPFLMELLNNNVAYQVVLRECENYTDYVIEYSKAMYLTKRDGLPRPLQFHYYKINYLLKAVDLQLLLIGKYFNQLLEN